MFYDTHFIVDVENSGQGAQVNGTVQITDSEGLFVSHSTPTLHFSAFPDENRSADGVLAHMVDVARVYDRVLVLATMHGLYVDQEEIVRLYVPPTSLPPRGTVKGISSSSRFHVYAMPLGEEVFVSGEAVLTDDTFPFASWSVNDC